MDISGVSSKCPAAFAALFRKIGKRLERHQVIVFNHILSPSELDYSKERIVFYTEEQGDAVWSYVVGDDDPNVERYDRGGRRLEEERMCGFLYQICAYEICMGSEARSLFYGERDDVSRILKNWNACPVAVRHTDDILPRQFCEIEQAIALVWHGRQGTTLCCGANHAKDLLILRSSAESIGQHRMDSFGKPTGCTFGYWEFFRGNSNCSVADFWQ
jgi:hypothetical protein